MDPRIEIVTMELCHTQCIFCKKDCYHQTILISECGHSFCVDCSIYFYQDLHLSPVYYGCPSCPNGCNNPKRGNQCDCDEYDAVKDNWLKTDPLQYHLWISKDTLYRYKNKYKDHTDFTAFRCPVCVSFLNKNKNKTENNR